MRVGRPPRHPALLKARAAQADVGGNQIGSPVTLPGVPVSNGLFTVQLNVNDEFGANAFNGDARWLEIQVAGTPLSPRQPLGAAPDALFSVRPWQTNGSDVFYSGGRVGVGASTPAHALDVTGDVRGSARVDFGNDGEIGAAVPSGRYSTSPTR